MLFHAAYSAETAVYHDVFGCRVGAELNEAALRAALSTVARRHAALRTRFALSGFSRPLQLVEQQTTIPLHVHDLRELDDAARQDALSAFMEEEKRRAFDWNRAPLLQLHAHRLSDASFYVTLSFHHAILDGWSVATLLAELFTLYTSSTPESPAALLPAPQLTYRDFVALEQAALDDESVQQFWDERLAAIEPLRVAARSASRSERRSRPTGRGRTRAGRQFVRRSRDTRSSVRRAAQEPAVGGAPARDGAGLGRDDVTTGLVVNGRPEVEDGERLLGLFLNTLPLSTKVEGSWRDLIDAALDAERELLPRRRYPSPGCNNVSVANRCSRPPLTTTTSTCTTSWNGSMR